MFFKYLNKSYYLFFIIVLENIMLPGNEVNFIGYLIEGKVVYLHKTKRLICLNGYGEDIILRKTMSHVLEYLFENATVDVVTDSELMENVWDRHGLSSSTQRVWQVMSNLKSKLFFLGLSDDVILRVSKKGYLLKSDSVERLFSSRVTSGIH
ncbi:helix-turn-helix domain-containing protein [Pantoea agglomerans]|nr:helix-turn-helix domain-containing protein [Pantoea agglomerans]NEG67981.1 helix-turn-helix domain-containing protein [Pantoea agglomerans]NEH00073.1 helix-turn-helix domain-containing protein [Pantoea agglomerans]NEH03852.1 helix-turn-helix domain-containing protein [Pantoea agglomerans]NEH15312.1 helix-turn-helix domain-containing protein [Pantoea agglomerans]